MTVIKKISILFILFFVVVYTVAKSRAETVEVRINGRLTINTCELKTPDTHVQLGHWFTHSQSGIGSGIDSVSPAVPFALEFSCPSGAGVKAKLDGNRYSSASPYYIGLDKGENSAKGVVIEVHHEKSPGSWQSIHYDSAVSLISKSSSGTNKAGMKAFYRQVAPQITGGSGNSSVTMTLEYQ
ncbi:fimbrial protein [Morganella psychrotolerans]|uniref:fimbrial protein n=1 Tax=Morganella psychrotolerans TaxID=368603 RepID=UPI0039B03906